MTPKFDLVGDSFDVSNDNQKNSFSKVFEEGTSPTIDFQFLDGRCEFLRTAHILHGEIAKADTGKAEILKLLFSTHTVIIEGYCLQEIYNLIKSDKLVRVKENDKRYINMVEDNEPFVTRLEVIWRKDEALPSSPDDQSE